MMVMITPSIVLGSDHLNFLLLAVFSQHEKENNSIRTFIFHIFTKICGKKVMVVVSMQRYLKWLARLG